MAASACLRIHLNLSDEQFAKLEALGPVVTKVTSAFLETRWSWPKRYEALTAFSFMVTDPAATEVDVHLLRQLAQELQLKLFGKSAGGDVSLLLHDGDEADTASFVQMDHATLRRLTQAPMGPTPFGGRLMQIGAAVDAPGAPQWQPLTREPSTAHGISAAAQANEKAYVDFRGIYFAPRQSFVGNVVSSTPVSAPQRYSLVDGSDRLPADRAVDFDLSCMAAAARVADAAAPVGVTFLPVCFSSLMRRSSRDLYDERFRALLADKKARLSAYIYDVPRSIAFQAYGQLHEALDSYFSSINLQVSDPGFEIDGIPPGRANSVTLRLPDAEERTRLAILKRYMERRESYKRRQIWPAVTNVRTEAELRACIQERVPFISGLAVCGPMSEPVGSQWCEASHLPLRRAA